MMKNIIITGSTDGIGKQTALRLAEGGHRILIHGRNPSKAKETAAEISAISGNKLVKYITADLSSLKEVKTLAEDISAEFNQVDILINNAGIYSKNRELTVDNNESTFAVNHLAPFLLTLLLLPVIKKANAARIINVSSVAHIRGRLEFDNLQGEKNFDPYAAYSLSKLANVLFTVEFAERLKGTGVTVNALHPGVIGTKLLYQGFAMDGAPLDEGAKTPVLLALSESVKDVTGKYFAKEKEAEMNPVVYDSEIRKKFWDISFNYVSPFLDISRLKQDD